MNLISYRTAVRSILISYLLVLVALPIAAVYVKGFSLGWEPFWKEISGVIAWKAILLTFKLSILTTLIQAVIGTFIAFVLVRYRFIGRRLLNSLVDLPFSLPTAVSGLMLLTLLGPQSLVGKWLNSTGINLLYNQSSIVIGMVFITFPFVIRTVQPMIEQFDLFEEEASYTLGAGKVFTFFHVLFPSIVPGIIAGSMLSFPGHWQHSALSRSFLANIRGKTNRLFLCHLRCRLLKTITFRVAAAVSIVLITFSLVVLWLVNVFQKRRDTKI